MKVLVSGSLAYDRIMDFPGRFSDHIVPEKVHMINLSFTVNRMEEKLGGTAGNIAYALRLLGETPIILAAIGKDYSRYFQWLGQNDIPTEGIRIIEEEFTAGAFITTDMADNQITVFNPGAMKYKADFNTRALEPGESFVIIAPGNIQDMVDLAHTYKEMGVPYIFDPGQAIPALSSEDLQEGIRGARLLMANHYEMELICHKVGTVITELLDATIDGIIVTEGEKGSTVVTRERETSIRAVSPQQVLDPTGAGDAYRAGVIKGLLEGRELPFCAMLGSTCAAYAVETYGTQEYRFTLSEFQERFQKHFGRTM